MKGGITMKGAYIWSVALAAALAVGCERPRDTSESTTPGTDTTASREAPGRGAGAESPAPGRSSDRDLGTSAPMTRASDAAEMNSFVEKMAAVGIAEVKLGELAAQRAANAEVKQFGRRMVADHQKANAELKQVAAKANITLPAETDKEHQDLLDRLSKLKGAEFDREYMMAMVDGHEDVAQELQRHADTPAQRGDRAVGTTGQGAQADQTAPVKQWAAKTLPAVQKHLEQARQIQGKLKQ
jgi:putative membrane protein